MMSRCAHCQAGKATHTWSVAPCAGKKPIDDKLCPRCDIMLNDLVLSFFNVPNTTKLIRRYLVKRGGE